MADLTLEEMETMIKEKEKDLLELKKAYRERRTEGLRQAMEQRREAERLVREEMKNLGVTEKINFGDDFFSKRFYF
jgi:aspartate aminotransferase-like enzyme